MRRLVGYRYGERTVAVRVVRLAFVFAAACRKKLFSKHKRTTSLRRNDGQPLQLDEDDRSAACAVRGVRRQTLYATTM